MRALPIRVRLTAWYFAVLAVTFVAFGLLAYLGMRGSITESVDEDLHDRLRAIGRLMERTQSEDDFKDELREHTELRPGSNLVQVSDVSGNWIHRTPAMARYGIDPKLAGIATVYSGRMPLRVLSASVASGSLSYRVQIATPMDDYYDALRHFRYELLIWLPVMLVVATLAGYWMSGRALRPVDHITRSAQAISAQNLSSRLAVPQTADEIQRLSETLNGMLERIEKAFARITQFSADASHELRTPVALMRTQAEIALRRTRSPEEYRDALTLILEELERTSDLIEKLMILTRTDSGVEALQRTRLDLKDVVHRVCESGKMLSDAKQIKFMEDVPEQSVWVVADSHWLERLFLILIDNAVKYTPTGGEIVTSLSTRNDSAVVEVRDTGIGIAEADLPYIFERFYRADKSRTPDSGGIGLGLSIGRWIAEAHRGRIDVQSNAGQGSAFRVTLPTSGRDLET